MWPESFTGPVCVSQLRLLLSSNSPQTGFLLQFKRAQFGADESSNVPPQQQTNKVNHGTACVWDLVSLRVFFLDRFLILDLSACICLMCGTFVFIVEINFWCTFLMAQQGEVLFVSSTDVCYW